MKYANCPGSGIVDVLLLFGGENKKPAKIAGYTEIFAVLNVQAYLTAWIRFTISFSFDACFL